MRIQSSCLTNPTLSSIDLSKNTKLKSLSFTNLPLKEIDLTKNIDLEYLYLNSTELTEIDVTKNTKLVYLHLQQDDYIPSENSYAYLSNTDLKRIKSIDVTNNLELSYLYLKNHDLVSIDLRNNFKLTDINANTLSTTYGFERGYLYIYGNPRLKCAIVTEDIIDGKERWDSNPNYYFRWSTTPCDNNWEIVTGSEYGSDSKSYRYGTNGDIYNMYEMSIKSNDDLYILNRSTRMQYKKTGSLISIKPNTYYNGTPVSTSLSSQGDLNYPQSFFITGDGTIYIANTANKKIIKKGPNDSSWTVVYDTVEWDNDSGGVVDYPYNVVIGSDGTIYVAGLKTLRKKGPSDSTFSEIYKTDTNDRYINDLEISSDNTLYLLIRKSNNHTKIIKKGSNESDWSEPYPDAGAHYKYYPIAMDISSENTIYFVAQDTSIGNTFNIYKRAVSDSDWIIIGDSTNDGGYIGDSFVPKDLKLSSDAIYVISDYVIIKKPL